MVDLKQNPDFINSFLTYYSMDLNKSKNSIKEYNYDLSNFFKFMSNHLGASSCEDIKDIDIHGLDIEFLNQIKEDDISAYIYYYRSNFDVKPRTLARKLSTIRIFFAYASKKEWIKVNPAQNIKTPKLDKRLPTFLTLEESKKLLEVSCDETDENGRRNFAIITLFLNCGMRLAELVSINISSIRFDECKLSVIGKGDKERVIYLNKACMDAINRYLEVRPRDGVKFEDRDALFLSERLERISRRTVQYIVEKELLRAGFDTKKYSTHKLRHTAATLMYQYGNVDIRALQKVLGHESISTTEIYTHVSDEQVRSAFISNPLSGEDTPVSENIQTQDDQTMVQVKKD